MIDGDCGDAVNDLAAKGELHRKIANIDSTDIDDHSSIRFHFRSNKDNTHVLS